MNVRNASKMLSTYNVAQWGNSYYDDNEKATSAYVRTPIFFPQARVDLVKACQERRSESPRIVFSRRSYNIGYARLTLLSKRP